MIALIDNYDSFVHNLARYIGELGHERCVIRNDATSAEAVFEQNPDAIILSPGPCTPAEAGVSIDIVRLAAQKHVPLLGVCLGHQCIAEAFGGTTVRAKRPRHGKTSPIAHKGHGLFASLPTPFAAARYHSLVAEIESSSPLIPIATATDDAHLMALAHQDLPVFGIQFHPESILTPHGHQILANFLSLAGLTHTMPPEHKELSP